MNDKNTMKTQTMQEDKLRQVLKALVTQKRAGKQGQQSSALPSPHQL